MYVPQVEQTLFPVPPFPRVSCNSRAMGHRTTPSSKMARLPGCQVARVPRKPPPSSPSDSVLLLQEHSTCQTQTAFALAFAGVFPGRLVGRESQSQSQSRSQQSQYST